MFNTDFYPTPEAVTLRMLEGHDVAGKVILEPSAGKGNMVDVLKANGAAEVLTCEINDDLRTILGTKSRVLGADFFAVESHHISHIDYIIMNPPFSNAQDHILHAFDIAPSGCKIISLCNYDTVKNQYSETRKQLGRIIDQYGSSSDLGQCFEQAERTTGVQVALITLQKPGESYSQEFEGFFMDDDPEENTGAGLMPYNVVRDLVNRYVSAVKLYDKQLDLGVQMNSLTSSFYGESLAFSCTLRDKPVLRNDYKKALQKSAWMHIFNMMDLGRTATRGLREDINKFVETQTQIPFTMKNVYRMLEIVIGTTEQRMDKALLEVFDKVIDRSDENKFYGPSNRWKTNGYYLLTEKFILPYITDWDARCPNEYLDIGYRGNVELLDDMNKALCYITGEPIENYPGLAFSINHKRYAWGEWVDWGFFQVRGYKKGTMHFKFKDTDLWARFNQRIAKLKGYPLYAHSTSQKQPRQSTQATPVQPTILLTLAI